MGHLTKIVGVAGMDKKISTRIVDAMMLRCVVPTDEVLELPVVAWTVGPKRWARLFQDLDDLGDLRHAAPTPSPEGRRRRGTGYALLFRYRSPFHQFLC